MAEFLTVQLYKNFRNRFTKSIHFTESTEVIMTFKIQHHSSHISSLVALLYFTYVFTSYTANNTNTKITS